MIPPVPQDRVNFWIESKRCQYALESYYVSNLDEQQLRESQHYLNKWGGDTCFLQIVKFPKDTSIERPYFTQHFDEIFYLEAGTCKPILKGRYLRIIFAYEQEEYSKYVEEYVIHTTNLVRLRYGFGAASECAFTDKRDLRTKKISFASINSTRIMAFGDGHAGNPFFENGVNADIKKIDESTLKPDASILLDESLKNDNSHHSVDAGFKLTTCAGIKLIR